MKKIIASLLTVAVLAAGVTYGTVAYFSDTEESVGNTISAGTIDISVDNENPWESTYTEQWGDFKPGGHSREMTFVIKNEGDNPANVWKKVLVTDTTTGTVTEPECTDQGGDWTGTCDWGSNTDDNDMPPYIHYSMVVDGVTVINEDWDVMLGEINDLWVPLRTLEPGESMSVTQTYSLDENAGNEYQGDEIIFNIVLYAEQLMGPGPVHTSNGVVLENKNGDPHWNPVLDDTWGLLTWDGSGNYRIRAWNLAGTQYRLRAWDAASDSDIGFFGSTYTTADVDDTGTYAGLTSNVGAKYWLQDTATLDELLTLWESNQVTP